MKKRFYLPVALLSLVISCSDNPAVVNTSRDSSGSELATASHAASNDIDEGKTKQVLDHHWQAFTKNSMDEVMADYTEESVLITPDATYKGLAQIRSNFEAAYKMFPADKSVFKLTKSVIDRDVAYILWQCRTPSFNLTYATDSFIIRDGKIIRQTYAGVSTPL